MSMVRRSPGGIGYGEMLYVIQIGVSFGSVRNREGAFIRATLPAVTAAAENAFKESDGDLSRSITDAPGKDSYPICSVVSALAYRKPPAGKGEQVVDFLRWVIHDGQETARNYITPGCPRAWSSRRTGCS